LGRSFLIFPIIYFNSFFSNIQEFFEKFSKNRYFAFYRAILRLKCVHFDGYFLHEFYF